MEQGETEGRNKGGEKEKEGCIKGKDRDQHKTKENEGCQLSRTTVICVDLS